MERTRKTWGEKSNIFKNDTCEISILKLCPNQRCSWHRHQAKFNLFYVLEGQIWIYLMDGASRVSEGQIFTTIPGEWHEFRTGHKSAKVIEIMYVQYDDADIEREKLGGPLEYDEPYLEE